LSKNPNLVPPGTQGTEIINLIVAFFSISILFFGSSVVMMNSYAEPQGELPPQLQQQLQQQGPTSNVTASLSPQLQQQLQQQGLTSNVTALSPQLQQQQAPPITFQPGEEEEEPCDGAYFVGPGGVTKCM
jgi:hypothetical protein